MHHVMHYMAFIASCTPTDFWLPTKMQLPLLISNTPAYASIDLQTYIKTVS